MPFLTTLNFVLVCILVIYAIHYETSRSRYQPSLFSLEFFKLNRLKRIKFQYLFGLTLLLIAVVYQSDRSTIEIPAKALITQIQYNPKPPAVDSPWSWKGQQTIHPAVANLPANVETSIESVAKYIAAQEPDPYLQIKALHDYVVSRVTYDLNVLKTGRRSPQDARTVFSTRKAVCEGYAKLFEALSRSINIPVAYVEGKVRRDLAPVDLIPRTLRLLDSNYDWTNHAWNAVKIAGNWQLVDTTWDDDDSTASAAYSSEYLMPPPKVMFVSHFPDLSSWQLLDRPQDRDFFEKQAYLTPEFYVQQLELISPKSYQTDVQKTASIKIENRSGDPKQMGAVFAKRKEDGFSLWALPAGNPFSAENPENLQKCQSQQTGATTEIACQFPDSGNYQVLMFSLESSNQTRSPKISPIGQLSFQVR